MRLIKLSCILKSEADLDISYKLKDKNNIVTDLISALPGNRSVNTAHY
jgi:hypothetical protein